eukprot:1723460-Amphidinium_carterae.1
MVATPQDNEQVAMPDPKKQRAKKHKPPDGAVRMSQEALLPDTKPPSGGGMTCAHAPSASTAAGGAMTSLAATGYSTPDTAEDSGLEQDQEYPEPEGKWEGGRTVSGNIKCQCCGESGLWSQFAFAQLGDEFKWKVPEPGDELQWRAAVIHNQKLSEVLALVKGEEGGK